MWCLGDGHNVLGFQAHPEMLAQTAYEKIWPALTANGRLNAEVRGGVATRAGRWLDCAALPSPCQPARAAAG